MVRQKQSITDFLFIYYQLLMSLMKHKYLKTI